MDKNKKFVYDKNGALMKTNIPGFKLKRGKVRDIYDLGDKLIFITTDRISAFDVLMANGIPDKGRILTSMSNFWMQDFNVNVMGNFINTHLLPLNMDQLPAEFNCTECNGRLVLCKKVDVFPVECIVRGYLTGSGWDSYKKDGTVCGIKIHDRILKCGELFEPIFTPSTKAERGQHDENITIERMAEIVGPDMAESLQRISLELYEEAKEYALGRGIIIADTKLEFGVNEGDIILVDEVLTPDSSRFWPLDKYEAGRDQESFDKQYVRDYLSVIGFNKKPPGPKLPDDVVKKTREKYMDALQKLIGSKGIT